MRGNRGLLWRPLCGKFLELSSCMKSWQRWKADVNRMKLACDSRRERWCCCCGCAVCNWMGPTRISFCNRTLAEKFRDIIGEQSSSKSGKFTFLNCFDMGSGTLSCGVKEGVKLYTYSIRNAHVENVRQRATEVALNEALQEGLTTSAAAKQAQKSGAKAAKLASRQAKLILGPIVSSGWDFFEAIYFGGTITEGFLRGSGTLFGTYIGGFLGVQRLGRLGYFAGSHLGSWIGGRIGLMFYDIINGINYIFDFVQYEDPYRQTEIVNYDEEDSGYSEDSSENSEVSDGWGFF